MNIWLFLQEKMSLPSQKYDRYFPIVWCIYLFLDKVLSDLNFHWRTFFSFFNTNADISDTGKHLTRSLNTNWDIAYPNKIQNELTVVVERFVRCLNWQIMYWHSFGFKRSKSWKKKTFFFKCRISITSNSRT